MNKKGITATVFAVLLIAIIIGIFVLLFWKDIHKFILSFLGNLPEFGPGAFSGAEYIIFRYALQNGNVQFYDGSSWNNFEDQSYPLNKIKMNAAQLKEDFEKFYYNKFIIYSKDATADDKQIRLGDRGLFLVTAIRPVKEKFGSFEFNNYLWLNGGDYVFNGDGKLFERAKNWAVDESFPGKYASIGKIEFTKKNIGQIGGTAELTIDTNSEGYARAVDGKVALRELSDKQAISDKQSISFPAFLTDFSNKNGKAKIGEITLFDQYGNTEYPYGWSVKAKLEINANLGINEHIEDAQTKITLRELSEKPLFSLPYLEIVEENGKSTGILVLHTDKNLKDSQGKYKLKCPLSESEAIKKENRFSVNCNLYNNDKIAPGNLIFELVIDEFQFYQLVENKIGKGNTIYFYSGQLLIPALTKSGTVVLVEDEDYKDSLIPEFKEMYKLQCDLEDAKLHRGGDAGEFLSSTRVSVDCDLYNYGDLVAQHGNLIFELVVDKETRDNKRQIYFGQVLVLAAYNAPYAEMRDDAPFDDSKISVKNVKGAIWNYLDRNLKSSQNFRYYKIDKDKKEIPAEGNFCIGRKNNDLILDFSKTPSETGSCTGKYD
jgi:hypothetical protein